jgi:murein DD-endopeptidase MepM/ murein hydrolase activator NlpD
MGGPSARALLLVAFLLALLGAVAPAVAPTAGERPVEGVVLPVVDPGGRLGLLLALWDSEPAESLVLPVVGATRFDFLDTFDDPRPGGRRHEGIDIFAARGTPVLSAADGVVLRVGRNNLGGNSVMTLGPGFQRFYYAHLDAYAGGLAPGALLRAGEPVGYVGNTGNAERTPPHLHFGIYAAEPAWSAVNPFTLLRSARRVTALPAR